jgi:hypothetical protein
LTASWRLSLSWFLRNDASDYDKFNWAINHASDGQLAAVASYVDLNTDLIDFNDFIYGKLQECAGCMDERSCGQLWASVRKVKHSVV